MQKRLKLVAILLIWITSNSLQTTQTKFRIPSSRYLASGFSAWISHGLWLSIPSNVERIPITKLKTLIDNSTNIDPDELFFWINGAAIFAYDLEEECCPQRSIELLDKAIDRHPNNSFLHYEKGKVYLLKLKNPTLAKKSFADASDTTLPILDF